ncbi:multicopper oxidase domain-containing protein [Cohnella sp. CFH 77786]|uniref:multicopper oxidase family protein n=1 Tax=Cohnella sp. CFH 77786 TaxID=2662265 RepID=UPI001C60A9AA|nr:multicopper oxidase family protein [Cohnella sp. CFH 77786]MBW5445331.1 multicopper oxidase domain-containing protein [Cohnella sp. CFH 77786]
MFETLAGILLTFAMTVLWALASLVATSLPYAANNQKLKRRRILLLMLSYAALLIGLLWYAFQIGWLYRSGWLFVEGTFKATIPLLLVLHIHWLWVTMPKVYALGESNKQPLTRDTWLKAAMPAISLSYYALTFVSGMAAFSMVIAQPILPDLAEIVMRLLLIVLLLAVPALILRRRYLNGLKGGNHVQGVGSRWLKFAYAGVLTAIVAVAVFVLHAVVGIQTSKLPEASDMMNHEHVDEGGGTPTRMTGSHHVHDHSMEEQNQSNPSSMVEVAALKGDISAPADRKFVLSARQGKVTLASGAEIDAWTYNGEVAPELRVRQGEMIEVKLVNQDVDAGVTIHWHGYNVPNAMDGVPGMTQNVVKPGQSFTYKFRANQEGSYWFHSHQQASEQVAKGLFGALIVDPKQEDDTYDEEVILINHRWKTGQGRVNAFGIQDGEQFKQIEPGKKVKLRVINTDKLSRKYLLQGASYRITSIDGVRIQNPDSLSDRTAFRLGAGGRYDVAFTMPNHPVLFQLGDDRNDRNPSFVFYTDTPPANPAFQAESGLFDPSDYGKPVVNAITAAAKFDREFKMILGNKMGFYNGKFTFLWTINGEVYPHVPTLVVKEGDKVKTTFVNKSLAEHPMHLHGHHMTVLKKNGEKVKTPWMTDTLNVLPGESYEVGFVADNPGMWMDHCHNLDHAATGMILHLMYDNVRSSYEVGTRSGNLPD